MSLSLERGTELTRAWSMHGLHVEHHGALAPAWASFWSAFPERPPTGRADLCLRMESVHDGAELRVARVASERAAPFFFHGVVQATRDAEATYFTAPDGSLVQVHGASPLTLRAWLAPAEHARHPEGLLHMALLWALRAFGWFDLHASGVRAPSGQRWLFVGDSGSGKSTLALALLEAGFDYLGDDRVLLSAQADGGIVVLGYPRAFHVGPKTLAAFSTLQRGAGASAGPASDKRLVEPQSAYPSRFDGGCAAPSALFFPRITSAARSSLRPLNQAEAFGELLLASAGALVEGMPYSAEQLELLQRLVALRSHAIDAGADVLTTPQQVAQLLLEAERGR